MKIYVLKNLHNRIYIEKQILIIGVKKHEYKNYTNIE